MPGAQKNDNRKRENLMSRIRIKVAIIGVLAFLDGCASNPDFCVMNCSSGNALITGHVKPPVSIDQVRLYVTPPANYQVIGLVEASGQGVFTEKQDYSLAVTELKRQAAKVGANGVIITQSYQRNTDGKGASERRIAGQAIFVKE